MVLSTFQKEKIANEKRFWLRTTRTCNNHCIFCHDSEIQNGEMLSGLELQRQIKKAKEEGYARLILSGGEPTIHPDIIELVDYARRIGLEWIQIISNGRMFAYQEFTRRMVEAGLSEVTVSFHSHIPEIADSLTGVKGSFLQTIKGIENLKKSNIVISIDIVLSTYNYRHLKEAIEFFHSKLGIGEFDILHLTPFGRALENYKELRLEPMAERREIRRVIKYAKEKGIILWTNRVPPMILEGDEEYIQDPYKILDEIQGRAEIFTGYLKKGLLECRSRIRCQDCFVRDFCDFLVKVRTSYLKKRIDRIIIEDPIDKGTIEELFDHLTSNATIISSTDILKDIESEIVNSLKELMIISEETEGLSDVILSYRPSTIISRNPDILKIPGVKKILILTNENIHSINPQKRVELLFPNAKTITEEEREIPDIRIVKKISRKYQMRIANLPLCISGRFYRGNPMMFRADFISNGDFDLLTIASEYLLNHNYHKSLRCKGCVHNSQCKGMHINHLRRFGFKILRPKRI